MIKIKIQDETTTFSHYGVSAKDGAPGRGSGRYPLGSGANPRSKNNSRQRIKSLYITYESMSSASPIRVVNDTVSYVDGKRFALENQDFFPIGEVLQDDRICLTYKDKRSEVCAKDEATGLYLDKPAKGVSKEAFDKYIRWRLENKIPPGNVGYPNANGRKTNCALCVIAHDLNKKGYDVTSNAVLDGQLDYVYLDAYKTQTHWYIKEKQTLFSICLIKVMALAER